ncbi:hypothetical protein J2785_006738 [Burkholderia ambifaria]|nr:antitoxin MazE family protein [Burkholderia ambifaria]MDR6503545.1 hypothetical protein [Burkholderia ambifaria]
MTSPREKRVLAHRQAADEADLRPIQVGVPDSRQPGFAEECARQSRVIGESAAEKDIMDFFEQASEGAWG